MARHMTSAWQQPHRRCCVEQLEDRSLLATTPLTVITHGFTGEIPQKVPLWVSDMKQAITSRTQSEVITFDWAKHSDELGSADSNEVAGRLYGDIHTRLLSVHGDPLNIHFIGHSRGAYVNMEVLRRLGADPLVNRVGFVQMTTLDPYPYGTDGKLEHNPGGIVDFADNYYQLATGTIPIEGEPLPGALNFNLTQIIRTWDGRGTIGAEGFGNHSEVHDWYHWTIDTSDNASPALQDRGLPTLNTALRQQLYGTLQMDLNKDGATDKFENGAKVGYYFSVAGGGIGRVVLDADGELFTVDVRAGTAPLYLGKITLGSAGIPADIAYSPQGELYVVSRTNKVFEIDIRFNNNQPTLVATAFAFENVSPLPTVSGLGFRANAFFFTDANRITEVWRDDPMVGRGVEFTGRMQPGKGDLTFDHNGDPYELLFGFEPSVWLYHHTHEFLGPERPSVRLPFTDFDGLISVGGMVYAFRPNSDWQSVDLGTWQLSGQGKISHAPLTRLVGAAALTQLARPVWHNHAMRQDVDDDQTVTEQDAQFVIALLSSGGIQQIADTDRAALFYDVSNDGWVSPLDLLLVINELLEARAAAAQLASHEQRQQAVNAVMTLYNDAEDEEASPISWLEPL